MAFSLVTEFITALIGVVFPSFFIKNLMKPKTHIGKYIQAVVGCSVVFVFMFVWGKQVKIQFSWHIAIFLAIHTHV